MSIADLLRENFIEGGPFFMTLHYLLWILVIIYTIRFIKNYRSTNRNYFKLEKLNTPILFIGGFGFLLSLFYRNIGMYSAFSAIEEAQDISLPLLAGGLKASLVAPLYSLFLFLVTSIIWFINRNKIRVERQS